MAKVGGSAAEAKERGFLAASDRIVMQREHLLHEARAEVLQMVAEGHRAPAPETLYAGGRDLFAAMKLGLWSMAQGGYTAPHDSVVGEKVALLIAGGDASAPGPVSEQHLLDLECQAFVELVATEATQQRIGHMLKTGKPLRN
jgi:3-hydroxyacyl-CoA dehydrogenase